MDTRKRQLQRSNDPKHQERWLSIKMRTGELSESMKKMLCALIYTQPAPDAQ